MPRHIRPLLALTLAALLCPTLAAAGTYSTPKQQQFTTAGATKTFSYTNLPPAIGDVTVKVELWGAYFDSADRRKYAAVEIDGTAQSNICQSGCGESCNDVAHTKSYTVDASTVADGQLDVVVDNSSGVHTRCSKNLIRVTVSYETNDPPVARDAEFTVPEDGSTNIELSASDPNGGPLTYEYAELPTHGQLSGEPPAVTYTPDMNYNGGDRFTFVVTDEQGATSKAGTVAITVEPVNDPPTWVRPEQTSYEIPAEEPFTLLVEATDIDDETLAYGIESAPEGSDFSPETRTFEWTPFDNSQFDTQVGDHTFTFTASDGEATIRREIEVTVTDPPRPDTGVGDTGRADVAAGDTMTGDTASGDTAAAPDTDAGLPDTGGFADTTDRPEYGLRGGGCRLAGGPRVPGRNGPFWTVVLVLCVIGRSCVVRGT